MRKIMKKIASAVKSIASKAKNTVNRFAFCSRHVLADCRGEGYVDFGVKILIAVVIGALLLSGLYALFNNTIMPTVTTKIQDLFNFKG